MVEHHLLKTIEKSTKAKLLNETSFRYLISKFFDCYISFNTEELHEISYQHSFIHTLGLPLVIF